MKGTIGWIVAAVVVIAAGAYYFMNRDVAAPVATDQSQQAQGTSEVSQGTAAETMSGMWRSERDTKFTREIRADGVIIDRYEGDANAGISGEWSIVNPAQEPAISAIAVNFPNMSVVKAEWEGGVEVTYFVVNEVTGTRLVTTDLSGTGSVTSYTKVNATQ